MKKAIFDNSKCLNAQQIQHYLSESTNDEQRYQIENHLLDCPLCSEALEGFANHYNFEEDKQLEELKNRFGNQTNTEASIRALPKQSRLITLNRVAAAAMMLIIPIAGLLYWNASSGERLYQSYYDGFELEGGQLRGGNDAVKLDANYSKAIDFYNAKDYANSLTYFEQYLDNNQEDAKATFLAGMAYLEEGNYPNAIDYLSTARFNDEQYYEEASWYLALAYVKNDNKTDARIILDELLKIENGFYAKKATALKTEISE